MRTIIVEPITVEAFAPYGELLAPPATKQRNYFNGSLSNGRPKAGTTLSLAKVDPIAPMPFQASQIERHPFSSQTFIPMDVSRYIAIVAPPLPDVDRADASQARAFLVPGDQGITFRAGAWHHPMTVLDRPATFAIFMWRDGGSRDDELVPLDAPFQVVMPG